MGTNQVKPTIETPKEETKYWHDSALDNLELLRATFIDHVFAPHVHEGYAIGAIVAGAESFAYRGTLHVAGAGNVVVINPAEVHTGQRFAEAGWSYRMLYPHAEQLRRAAAQLTGSVADYPFFPQAVINDPPLARQLCTLHEQLETDVDALTRESLWLTFLTALILRHADHQHALVSPLPHSEQRTIRWTLDYMHANYASSIALDDLSAIAYLSPYHLLRLFKAEVGLPPHAYLTQLRVHRAKPLLAAGLPIAAVAQQVGFTDQSHLSRHFKRIVGVPPGQYRP